jgi:hypothetical protein
LSNEPVAVAIAPALTVFPAAFFAAVVFLALLPFALLLFLAVFFSAMMCYYAA